MSTRVPPSDKPLSSIWWMHPAVALGGPTVLVAVCALMVSPQLYDLYWRTGKFVQQRDLLMTLASVGAFTLGTLVMSARRGGPARGRRWAGEMNWNAVRTLFNLCFWLSLIGYALWTLVGIRNGLTLGLVIDALRGNSGATYEVHLHYLVPVAGVTSLTQFGIAAVAFGVPLGLAEGWHGVRGRLVTLLSLGVFRALVNSERLGFIELALPFVISYLWNRGAQGAGFSRRVKRIILMAPLLAASLLFTVFSASEYSRSWLNFYAARESSFLRFSALRLAGYYVTAYNNGALLVHSLAEPLGGPYFTAVFARHFPVLSSAFDVAFPVKVDGEELYGGLLSGFANPELNNPSGIFLAAADYGNAGSLVYWLMAGIACGYLYGSFLRYTAAGMFLYPVIFVSLIETPRVLYWADGRVFPPVFMILFSCVFVFYGRMGRLRAPRPRPEYVYGASSTVAQPK